MDHPPNHNPNERLQKQIKTADNSHHESGGAGFNYEQFNDEQFNYECSDYRVSQ